MRTPLRRMVVIVDQTDAVVARQPAPAPQFIRFTGDTLPEDVRSAAHLAPHSSSVLPDGCVMHVVRIGGGEAPLRALIFEEFRLRAVTGTSRPREER